MRNWVTGYDSTVINWFRNYDHAVVLLWFFNSLFVQELWPCCRASLVFQFTFLFRSYDHAVVLLWFFNSRFCSGAMTMLSCFFGFSIHVFVQELWPCCRASLVFQFTFLFRSYDHAVVLLWFFNSLFCSGAMTMLSCFFGFSIHFFVQELWPCYRASLVFQFTFLFRSYDHAVVLLWFFQFTFFVQELWPCCRASLVFQFTFLFRSYDHAVVLLWFFNSLLFRSYDHAVVLLWFFNSLFCSGAMTMLSCFFGFFNSLFVQELWPCCRASLVFQFTFLSIKDLAMTMLSCFFGFSIHFFVQELWPCCRASLVFQFTFLSRSYDHAVVLLWFFNSLFLSRS